MKARKQSTVASATTALTDFLAKVSLKFRVMHPIICAGFCFFLWDNYANYSNSRPLFVHDEFGRIHGNKLFEACQGYRGTMQWQDQGCTNNTGDAIPSRLSNFSEPTYALDGLGITNRIDHLRLPARIDKSSAGFWDEYLGRMIKGSTSFVDTIDNFLTAEEVEFWQRTFDKYDDDHDVTLHNIAVMGDRDSKYLPFFDRPYAKGLLSRTSSYPTTDAVLKHQYHKLQQKLKYFFTSHLEWKDVNGKLGEEIVRNISCVLRSYPPDYVPPTEIYDPIFNVIPKSISYSKERPHTVTIYLTGSNGIDTINTGGTFFWNRAEHRSCGRENGYFYLPARPGKLVWFSNYDASDNTNFKMLNTPAPSIGQHQLVVQCS